jgi:hypothetical protein
MGERDEPGPDWGYCTGCPLTFRHEHFWPEPTPTEEAP